MRPVRLEMDGFGSFRQPSTVDFTDADFFALVGPTGAGKSTVVDAIVFALYGSVPRWDDRRAVGWALAPTATRGVVTLSFDVGADRYVVARELRRSAQGRVTVKNARLERGGEVLAADGEVSAAVEKLLGLSYDHFVRCVILPQGDFARFLHSSPKERQDTLVDLLGIRIYREVATRARTEEAAARQRADYAAHRLEGYADATPDAAAAAAARIDAIAAAGAEVARRVPVLVEASGAVAAAAEEVRRLTGERAKLAGLRMPRGLDDLTGARRAAAAALSTSDAELAVAEKADTAAREALAAAPERAPLERAGEAWAELAELDAQLPEAVRGRAAAEAAVRAVEAEGAAARDAVTQARERREEVLRADMAAALRPHLVAGRPCPVCAHPYAPAEESHRHDGAATQPADQPEGVIPGLDVGGARPRTGRRAPAAGEGEADDALAVADEHLRIAEADVARLQRDWQAANRGAQQAAGRAETLTARADALRARLGGGPDAAAVTAGLAELTRAERAARDADAALRAARRDRDAAARTLAGVDERLAGARAELDRARDPLVPLGAPPPARDDLAADWLALAEWALAAAEERAAALEKAERAADEARGGLLRDEEALRADLAAAGIEVPPGRSLAGTAEAAVARAAEQAAAAAERIAERQAEAAEERAALAEAEDAAGVAKLLGQLLKADGFERWLLGSALDVLVADAGATLLELSGGQFELTHDGRDFAVVDHADADSVRPVRTLSGGETFQASLALALALSAQLAGLAAGGTARLDAIVLDEGFGTLDEATLDVVASTLESLAAGGDRMVGVVTHVGALAERVPVRYVVSRTAAGSTVERQDV
ncbi:MAG TPA: SMC family ATPase [Mycobacteriales bacterium]